MEQRGERLQYEEPMIVQEQAAAYPE
jgi:hypothetical protein